MCAKCELNSISVLPEKPIFSLIGLAKYSLSYLQLRALTRILLRFLAVAVSLALLRNSAAGDVCLGTGTLPLDHLTGLHNCMSSFNLSILYQPHV